MSQHDSLLKYENPVLISSGKEKDKKGSGKTLRKASDAGSQRGARESHR